ncbi:hypothetical protein CJ030_MR8G015406 [Morella rubra]|uniref:Protein BPS1, chloroplastic n=1 Tax=Morella rubra TaxID=262757 RepID=A0A6A1UTE1_9ROSI|nr:hypothetical protein CJ030_MR8G015406 [Morella rubra]
MALPNFDALRDLHNSANDLLHSPPVQRALFHRRQEKWVHEVSEASLWMLDKEVEERNIQVLEFFKGIKYKCFTSDLPAIDGSLKVVVDVLKEVRATAISIVESPLSLISIPWLDRKSAKGSFASRFVRVSDCSMYDVCDLMALQSANKRLEAVEIAIEDLEAELECTFRRLIQTRLSLLNILTN